MFTRQIERSVVGLGNGVQQCALLDQSLYAIQVVVYDRMNKRSKVVVVDQVDGVRVNCRCVSKEAVNTDSWKLTSQQCVNHVETAMHAGIMERYSAVDIRPVDSHAL